MAYNWRVLRARYLRIVLFSARAVLSVVFWNLLLPRLGLGWLARRAARARYVAIARRFRALAIRMGGVLIKVGQFLSARVDVLPEYVTAELADLQDEVPPEDFAKIQAAVEGELGSPIAAKFAVFEQAPLAAASLGQAHRARLPGGQRVVVKVQRPDIERLIETDLAALRTVVSWIRHYPPIRRRADLEALLAEFSRTLWEEVDYVAEAGNAERFREMFAGDPGVRVPLVYPEISTRRVLVLEDVYFIKITDYAAITAAGVDRAEVADRLFRTYLHQIFEAGFFHADPHPGNLFVEAVGSPPTSPPVPLSPWERGNPNAEWRLVFVDFGMVGHVPPEAKAALRDLVVAVGTRDPAGVVRAYQRLGVLLPSADLDRLGEMEAAVFDRFWGKTMGELRRMDRREFSQITHQFREVLYELPFQVPSDMIYVGRCVAILSGMCTGLNPEFNLFEGLAPFAAKLVAEQGSDEFDDWLDRLIDLGRRLLVLPGKLEATLTRLERGELSVITRSTPAEARRQERQTRAINRLAGGLVLAVLILAGTQLVLGGERTLGLTALGAAAAGLAWLLVSGR